MLSAYVNASDMEGAEKFFKRLIQDGFEPNVVTYGTLMKGYAKINDLEMLMKKYEEMLERGIKANQTILTTIMDAYGKSGDFDNAVHWFKEMESNGISPDKKAKNVLLSLAKTDHEREEVNELIVHFSENKSLPNGSGVVRFVEEDDEEDNYEYFDDQLTKAYDEHTAEVS